MKPLIKALFKYVETFPPGSGVVDTTSSGGAYRDLSPFVLGPIQANLVKAANFENLWQFSKVYKEHVDSDGNPTSEWRDWRHNGFIDKKAHRYPMGKGRVPEYSYWNGEKLGYIEARKKLYAFEYAKNVLSTNGYKKLEALNSRCQEEGAMLILLDYDAYDHEALSMTLKDVINNPKRKMGHAFVLIMMLTGVLEECIGS